MAVATPGRLLGLLVLAQALSGGVSLLLCAGVCSRLLLLLLSLLSLLLLLLLPAWSVPPMALR